MTRRWHQPLMRQQGVAIVMALLLTTLAITIVASLFWQQQVQVRSIENQRLQLQKQWILRGALDWAQLILRENARTSPVDSLDDPWAVPLEETRLDQYVEGSNSADASDAAISGNIVDAESRFNVRNLYKNGQVDPTQLEIYQRLLTNLNLEPSLADKLASAIQSTATQSSVGGDSMVQSMRISYFDDLRAVPGYTPAVMEKLKDYVVVLPEVTPTINVNTASAELIAATVGTLSLPDAKALVATRARSGHFNDIKNGFETTARISLDATQEALLATTTDYFIVNGNVRLSHAALHMQTLIQRSRAAIGTPQATRLWWIRQR